MPDDSKSSKINAKKLSVYNQTFANIWCHSIGWDQTNDPLQFIVIAISRIWGIITKLITMAEPVQGEKENSDSFAEPNFATRTTKMDQSGTDFGILHF